MWSLWLAFGRKARPAARPRSEWRDTWRASTIRGMRFSRAMWLAEAAGSPVGYVAGHLTRRFECDGELQWIYVVAEHRGAGVAAELLRLLASRFAEHGARRVCVDVGDERARGFYRRFGAMDLRKQWLVWNDIRTVLGGSVSTGGTEG